MLAVDWLISEPAGGWSTWGMWDLCPSTCSKLPQSRVRYCLQPEKPCDGFDSETRSCGYQCEHEEYRNDNN